MCQNASRYYIPSQKSSCNFGWGKERMSSPSLLGVLMKINCCKRKEISLVFFRDVSFHRFKNFCSEWSLWWFKRKWFPYGMAVLKVWLCRVSGSVTLGLGFDVFYVQAMLRMWYTQTPFASSRPWCRLSTPTSSTYLPSHHQSPTWW